MKPNVASWPPQRRLLQVAMVATGIVVLVAALQFGAGPRAAVQPNVAPTAPVAPLAAGVGGEVHYHPGRPAHIHEGSCDDLGDVAFALNPVGAGQMVGAEMAGITAMAIGQPIGQSAATPVEVGSITLDTPLRKIVSGVYALNVQISEFDYGNIVACGDVGGVVADDTLAFGLGERNGSGFTGMALLKRDGKQTRVEVYLIPGDLNSPV